MSEQEQPVETVNQGKKDEDKGKDESESNKEKVEFGTLGWWLNELNHRDGRDKLEEMLFKHCGWNPKTPLKDIGILGKPYISNLFTQYQVKSVFLSELLKVLRYKHVNIAPVSVPDKVREFAKRIFPLGCVVALYSRDDAQEPAFNPLTANMAILKNNDDNDEIIEMKGDGNDESDDDNDPTATQTIEQTPPLPGSDAGASSTGALDGSLGAPLGVSGDAQSKAVVKSQTLKEILNEYGFVAIVAGHCFDAIVFDKNKNIQSDLIKIVAKCVVRKGNENLILYDSSSNTEPALLMPDFAPQKWDWICKADFAFIVKKQKLNEFPTFAFPQLSKESKLKPPQKAYLIGTNILQDKLSLRELQFERVMLECSIANINLRSGYGNFYFDNPVLSGGSSGSLILDCKGNFAGVYSGVGMVFNRAFFFGEKQYNDSYVWYEEFAHSKINFFKVHLHDRASAMKLEASEMDILQKIFEKMSKRKMQKDVPLSYLTMSPFESEREHPYITKDLSYQTAMMSQKTEKQEKKEENKGSIRDLLPKPFAQHDSFFL